MGSGDARTGTLDARSRTRGRGIGDVKKNNNNNQSGYEPLNSLMKECQLLGQ